MKISKDCIKWHELDALIVMTEVYINLGESVKVNNMRLKAFLELKHRRAEDKHNASKAA